MVDTKKDTEIFYTDHVGSYPFQDETNRIKTEKMLEHLVESLGEQQYKQMQFDIFEQCAPFQVIDNTTIPDSVYKDSYIERGRFYYHPKLRINSKPPCFSYEKGITIVYPYFTEPIERFTIDNIIEYGYNSLRIPTFLLDTQKDKKAISYLLKTFNNNPHASALDLLLYTIDCAASSGRRVTSLISMSDFAVEGVEKLGRIKTEAKARGYDRYIWRWEVETK